MAEVEPAGNRTQRLRFPLGYGGRVMSSGNEFSAEELAFLRPIFMTSAREHLASIARISGELKETDAGDPAVEALHRSIHSLKGAALQIGFLQVGQTARMIEQVVLCARALGPGAPAGWLALVQRGVPVLTDLLDAIERDEEREQDAGLLLALEDWLKKIDEGDQCQAAG